jgi:hypothetical protein
VREAEDLAAPVDVGDGGEPAGPDRVGGLPAGADRVERAEERPAEPTDGLLQRERGRVRAAVEGGEPVRERAQFGTVGEDGQLAPCVPTDRDVGVVARSVVEGGGAREQLLEVELRVGDVGGTGPRQRLLPWPCSWHPQPRPLVRPSGRDRPAVGPEATLADGTAGATPSRATTPGQPLGGRGAPTALTLLLSAAGSTDDRVRRRVVRIARVQLGRPRAGWARQRQASAMAQRVDSACSRPSESGATTGTVTPASW